MALTKKLVMAGIAGVQLCSMAAFAQEERNYDASLSLGFVGTSGNTETQTFNTEFLLTFRAEKWTHNLKFQALGAAEDDDTKAERYYLENKSDYNLDDDQYFFLLGSYTDDRFSGFDYQAAASAGYGRYFIRQDDLSVQGYVGVGYRQSNVEVTTNLGEVLYTESEGEAIFTIGENMEWVISDNSKLVQSFVSEIGGDLTVTKFDIALESNIIGNLATRLALQIRNNSEVPQGLEKTDTQVSVSMVYSF